MIEIEFRGARFGALKLPNGGIVVKCNHKLRGFSDEDKARKILGDYGLPRRPARRLLDAEVRGTGPYADPAHSLRVKITPR